MSTPVGRALIAGLVLLAGIFSRAAAQQDDPAAGMQTLIQAGDAGYLRGDYEAGRQAFEKAWQLAQESPPENPVRYDILKRLANIRAAAGEFADADNYLQLAINWRENTLGQNDPKIADDLLVSGALCRNMKNYDRADAIRAYCLATGLAQQGAEQLAESDKASALALYRRALAVLDPPSPVYQELRAAIEGVLKLLEAPPPKKQPKKTAPPRRAE